MGKNTLAVGWLIMMALSTLPCALAEETPRPGRVDKRVQSVHYRPGEVYHIQARYTQETLVTFGAQETIVYVGVGDAQAWQAEPKGHHLVLKPLEGNANTNMNILTQHSETGAIKAYAFQLDALEPGDNTQGTWQLVFRYPEEEQRARVQALQFTEQQRRVAVATARKMRAQDWNMAYAYSGDAVLAPEQVMDDGTFTYFHFATSHTLPAIFVLNPDGSESLVNWHIDGRYVVVQRTAREFLLRLGELTTRIYNEALDGADRG